MSRDHPDKYERVDNRDNDNHNSNNYPDEKKTSVSSNNYRSKSPNNVFLLINFYWLLKLDLKNRNDEEIIPVNVLAAFNIPRDMKEEELRDLFSREAPLLSMNMVIDKETNVPKGFAFFTYETINDATITKAALHGMVLEIKTDERRNIQILFFRNF